MVLYTSGNLINSEYSITNLLANTTYTFIVTPFLNNNPEYYQTIQVTTLAVIGSLDIVEIYDTSILLRWDRLAYAYNNITISWTNVNLLAYYYSQPLNINNKYYTGLINNVPGVSNLITGLSPNSPYFFTITAYNSIGVATPEIITNTVVTIANLSSISCHRNDTTLTSITVFWTGVYTYTQVRYMATNLEGASGSFLSSDELSSLISSSPFISPIIYNSSYTINNLNSNTTYNIAVYPYNSVGVSNIIPITIQWTTLPSVQNVYVNNITAYSVRVNWDYNRSYYNILLYVILSNTNSIVQKIDFIQNTYIDIYNLLPNTAYIFKLVPMCKQIPNYQYEMRGRSYYTNPVITLATVGRLSAPTAFITNKSILLNWLPGTFSSLNLNYSNAYQSCNIYNIGPNVLSIAINNLYGNMNYNINLYPINSIGASNIASNIIITTLPNIAYLRIDPYTITSNSLHLLWSSDNIYQSFSSADIYWVSQQGYLGSNLAIKTSHIVISNLLINTKYNFTLIPYNLNNKPGSNLYATEMTYATVTNLIATNIKTNSIDFKWNVNYTSLQIKYYDIMSPLNIYDYPQLLSSNKSNITINDLMPNINYIFNFYGINSSNIITNKPVSIPVITLPNVNTITIIETDITSNSINVSWDTNSAYKYILLSWHTRNNVNNIYSSIITSASAIYNCNVPNLIPNTEYKFSITPYNINYGSDLTVEYYQRSYTIGNTIVSGYYYTNSHIFNGLITNYTDVSITVSWASTPQSYYNYIYIQWINGKQQIFNNKTSFVIDNSTYITIYPNNLYRILLTSFNSASPNMQGTSLYAIDPNNNNATTIVTLPNAGVINNNAITENTISVSWGNINYYSNVSISLYTITDQLITYIPFYTMNNYSFTQLVTNTAYKISVLPYNFINKPGNVSTAIYATYATVGTASLSNLTDSSINIQWGIGSYSSITIQLSSNNILLNSVNCSNSLSCNITGLISNKNYTVSVYPNNLYLDKGVPSQFSITTYATVKNITVQEYKTNSVSLLWSGGSYSSILFNWYDIDGLHSDISQINTNIYTITTLYPNRNYTISLLPVNIDGIPSYINAIKTNPITTYASISSFNVINISENSAVLSINNGILLNEYSSYNLRLTNNNTGITLLNEQNILGCNYNLSNIGIIPNTEYRITLIPNNINSIATPIKFPPLYQSILDFYSLAIFGGITNIDNEYDHITLSWNQSIASYITVSWLSYLQNIEHAQTQYTIANLYANTIYTIGITPYNNSQMPNNTIVISQCTLPILYSTNISLIGALSNQIEISWNGHYNYVNVQSSSYLTNYNSNVYNNSLTLSVSAPDTLYDFQLQPYNYSNVSCLLSDKPLPLYIRSLPRIYTLVFYGGVTNPITSSSVYLDWYNQFNQSSGGIGISWYPPDSFISGAPSIYPNNRVNITGLQPNVNYIFSVAPYNSGGAGIPLTIQATTLPAILFAAPYLRTNYSSNVVIGGFSNLLISWSNLLIPNSQIYSQYVNSTVSITSNIMPDALYTFTYIPFNNNNIAGSPYIIPKVSAYATVGPLYITNSNVNTIDVAWITTGYKYDSINIYYNNLTNIYANTINNSYHISGLNPNTFYTIYAVPVNSLGMSDINNYSYITVYTLPNITNHTFIDINYNSTITSSNAILFLTGSFSNAILSLDNVNQINIMQQVNNSTIAVAINNLNANTLYTYSVIPYNITGIGSVINDSFTTLSIITSISALNISSNLCELQWTYGGLQNNLAGINIYWASTQPNISGFITFTSPYSPKVIKPPFYPNVLYSIYAQAVSSIPGVGRGIPSPIININTLPVIGNSISLISITDTIINFSWTNPSYGYTYVNIYISSNLPVAVYSNVVTNNYTISNLTPQCLYNLNIIPYNQTNAAGIGISRSFSTLTSIDPNSLSVTMTLNSDLITSTAILYWYGIYRSIKYYYYWTDYNGILQTTFNNKISITSQINSAIVSTILNPNIRYTFVVEPYDDNNLIGIPRQISRYSLPSLNSVSILSYTDTSATIAWGAQNLLNINNNYAFVNIVATPQLPQLYTNIITSPVILSNLLPNTQYQFTIIPYNSDSPTAFGNSNILNPIQTYANLTRTSNISTTNSIIITELTGTFNYVKLRLNGIEPYPNPQLNFGQGYLPYILSNLIPNTLYTLVYIPYTSGQNPIPISDALINSSIYTKNIYTLATITDIQANPSTISNTISWNVNNNYNYLFITWIPVTGSVANAVAGSSLQINYPISSYVISQLVAYTTYQITITVYNYSGVANILPSFSSTTLVYISSIMPLTITANSIEIKWIGEYSSVQIYNNINIPSVSSLSFNLGISSHIFTGFSANQNCTFYITPFDMNGIAGSQVSCNIITLPIMQNIQPTIQINTILSGSATIYWNAIANYVTITNNEYISSTSMPISYPPITILTGSSFINNILKPNMYYTFTITPYNANNLAGASIQTSQILTYGKITGLTIIKYDFYNLTIGWNPGGFASVNIQLSVNGTITQYINNLIGTQYDFNNALLPSTQYTMTLYAVNNINQINTFHSDISVISGYTLPVINSFQYTSNTYNQIFLQWSGYYNKVILQWVGTDGLPQAGPSDGLYSSPGNNIYTYIANGLSTNITYTFTLIPYNASTNAAYNTGAQISLVATTLGVIDGVTIGVPTTNSLQISWNIALYNYVIVSWMGTTSSQSMQLSDKSNLSYPVTGLQANGQYIIMITPYNNGIPPASGKPYISRTIYTLSIINSFSATAPQSQDPRTNLYLQWSGNYSSLTISWTSISAPTSGTLTNVQGTSIYISYLTPGASYTFTLLSYNIIGIASTYVPIGGPVTMTGTTLS